MAKLINQSYVNYSWMSACQVDVQPFEGNLSTCGCLTSLRNKAQQKQPSNFQHQYLPELLISMYSYHLMMKSVSCCCVGGTRPFSNLVTYVGTSVMAIK